MSCVLLAITGSIAAYKTPELIRLLKKKGHRVIPVVSKSAEHFVSTMVLSQLSGERCYTEREFITSESNHVSLAREADFFVLAPASANTIAKCVHGIADNFITTLFLMFQGPMLVVPAMHTEMYLHPATQDNLVKMSSNALILGPVEGDLACDDVGLGRMADPSLIVNAVDCLPFSKLMLKKSLLISVGGTRESIDDVRYISNLSSGKLGNALALMAHLFDAKVTIVSTVPIIDAGYASVIYVTSHQEMNQALEKEMHSVDCLIMAAAVSDFTCDYSPDKVRRQDHYSLKLVKTDDILRRLSLKFSNVRFIGFCLGEESELESLALDKCRRKGCDYVVANPLDSFGKEHRSFLIVNKETVLERFNAVTLSEMAFRILSLVCN